ncbi:lytic transglycosylase, partial [Streptomyces sp. NPDC002688]
MAAQFGRRLRKGATTTAVAAAAVAALSASQAPGVTVDDHGRQTTSAQADQYTDDKTATGNTRYFTDLPPLESPNPAPTTGGGAPAAAGSAEAG